MPILDTVVLFGAVDPEDKLYKESVRYLRLLENPTYYLAGFALVEFDTVMKSRGFTSEERITEHALLEKDYPIVETKTRPISPRVMYTAARYEQSQNIDYFDACIAAETILLDGQVISTDSIFDKLPGLKRVW